jgi:peptidoglycan/xylan/chitin deacetylase (PgdA/CDA1 family)
MKWYPDRIPEAFSRLFDGITWHLDRDQPTVYLTFDDGPTPQVTDFVLDQLDQFNYKASFFCIGDCVMKHPTLFQKLIIHGHAVGNHTHNHLNGWKVSRDNYLENVALASKWIESSLFRPPYGRITPFIVSRLKKQKYRIIMWDVLSGDFDTDRDPADCLQQLKENTCNGSIIVFHDSEKAFPILEKILPDYLKFLKKKGFEAQAIPMD